MNIILTHTHADFDGIAAMLGVYKLNPQALPVLPRQLNHNVREFLHLYRNGLPHIDIDEFEQRRKSQSIEQIILVDTQSLPDIDLPDHAVRAQHLRRWLLPRSDFPMDRAGYLTWRTRCAKMHAELAGEVLEEVGYDEETIGTVQRVLTKRGLKTDANVQLLEDTACLVFLEHYAAEFAGKHPKDKVIDIVQKTWKKMSDEGHAAAMELPLDPGVKAVVEEALAG